MTVSEMASSMTVTTDTWETLPGKIDHNGEQNAEPELPMSGF